MRESSREKVDFWAKEEEEKHDYDEDRHISLAQSTSRRWSAFRNPRIVRVSRALGGKDRHSKVCTVRGLRDRRIRLSVNTAVELYDLQDKLGVSQPSKVIDWLLEVSKHDIDKLPPLQVPPGFAGFPFHSPEFAPSNPSFPPFFTANFPFLRHGLAHHPLLSRDNGLQIDGALSGEGQWTTATGDLIRAKGKEVERESSFLKKTTWIDPTDRESEGVDGVMSNRNIHVSPRVSFLPVMANFSSHISSQFGSHHGFMPQTAHHFSQSRPFTPSIFPAGSSLVVENNFQPFSSGSNSFIMPSLHSTVPAEYVKLLRPENRAEG